MKESNLQFAILEYLATKKHFCWRNNSGAFRNEQGRFYRFGAQGSPDILCCIQGQMVGIEAKTESGRQSPAQQNFQRQLEKAGGRYLLVRSIDEVIDNL